MSEQEWLEACAKLFRDKTATSREDAEYLAGVCLENQDCVNDYTPEEAFESEVSYWDV